MNARQQFFPRRHAQSSFFFTHHLSSLRAAFSPHILSSPNNSNTIIYVTPATTITTINANTIINTNGTAPQVRVREPELLRPEHPAEPRLPPALEALQLVHRAVRVRPVPRHHARRQLEGEPAHSLAIFFVCVLPEET